MKIHNDYNNESKEFYEKMALVADALGSNFQLESLTEKPDHKNIRSLSVTCQKSGFAFYVTSPFNYAAKDKVSVSAIINRRLDGSSFDYSLPEIELIKAVNPRISFSKTPKKIASDIKSRFINKLNPLYNGLKKVYQADVDRQKELLANYYDLHKLAKSNPEKLTIKSRINLPDLSVDNEYTETISSSYSGFRLELTKLSFEEAEKVLELVKELKAGRANGK